MTDDTTFPFISKADIAKVRELIEKETGMSKRSWTLVDTIFTPPPYPPLAPSTLFPAEPASPFVLTKMGRIQDITDEDLEGFEFCTDDKETPDVHR